MPGTDAPLAVRVRYETDGSAAEIKAALLQIWAEIQKEASPDDRDLRPPVG